MRPFRESAARKSANYLFSPAANDKSPRPIDDPEVRAYLRTRAEAVGGGRKPTAVEFCFADADVDVRTRTYVNVPACDSVRVTL
jgi:hypothetical protein